MALPTPCIGPKFPVQPPVPEGGSVFDKFTPANQKRLREIFAGFGMTPVEQENYMLNLLGIIGAVFDGYFAELRASVNEKHACD